MKKYVYRLLLLLTVLALAGCGEKKTEAVAEKLIRFII